MTSMESWTCIGAFLPAACMLFALVITKFPVGSLTRLWRCFNTLAVVGLLTSIAALGAHLLLERNGVTPFAHARGWLSPNLFGAWVSVLVQLLGTAIGIYSSKHLQGEPRQRVYIAALAGVLASVHFLLLTNHWVVLIVAWAAIGKAMHALLCFYPDRPFALLAAHKKRVTDRVVDGLLVIAAALAWIDAGSGSITVLWEHIQAGNTSWMLELSGMFLAIAVIGRTALMPVHGWLVQVMEAPTPVSALLHAGVVNLGGFVLVFFAPLLEVSISSRWLLVIFGLVSAVVAGLVLLTRVSQKVHLAWSTIAQMGFMLLECGLGLYLLAALHLLGHSLYKAHNFLAASSVVHECKRRLITGSVDNALWSMVLAVPLALVVVFSTQAWTGSQVWPWWWSGVLALAWAPLLWVPVPMEGRASVVRARFGSAVCIVIFLTVAAWLVDFAPIGVEAAPLDVAGVVALLGMLLMYFGMLGFQRWPQEVTVLRRWVYAGFYMDEWYTRWVLRYWPMAWVSEAASASRQVDLSLAHE